MALRRAGLLGQKIKNRQKKKKNGGNRATLIMKTMTLRHQNKKMIRHQNKKMTLSLGRSQVQKILKRCVRNGLPGLGHVKKILVLCRRHGMKWFYGVIEKQQKKKQQEKQQEKQPKKKQLKNKR